LKNYIIENNKTKEILEQLGCFNIKTYSKEYRCGSLTHSNSTSISIKSDSLKAKIYTKEDKILGDIFTLCMDIKNIKFVDSIKYIHEILGLKYTGMSVKPKEDKVDILQVFKRATKKYKDYTNEELKIFNEDMLSEFIKMPYIGWVQEGILPHTQDIFGIGYSRRNNRIIIPHKYWCGNENDYVGVIGRTLVKNYDMFDIPKYFPLQNFPKGMNIYGLQENYQGIQEAGYINIFESEKSPMKRHSRLDYTGVALGGHEITEEQAKILIGLNVDIIIQMDSDIPIHHVRNLCEKFYGIRPCYYVTDSLGLLGDKESPADKHNKVYMALFNRKVEYNEKEHQIYLKEERDRNGREKN